MSRTPLILVALLAILLTLPSLWVGFAQDDYIFLSIFRGTPDLPVLEQSIWDTYTFSEGDPQRNHERMERGILPWWAVPEWKVDMWRPLPSLSHWLDFKLFGENPLPMHVHSVLLYGAACLAVGLFFRALLGPAALLATVLFAVDSGHGIVVGWLSNRHAIYVTGLGALALWCHHRWRQQASWEHPWRGWSRGGLPALGLLALALLCGEGAVGLGGYFFAYAVFLDPLARTSPGGAPRTLNRAGAARATVALLPYLGVVAVWRVLYNALGHGTHGSWLYTDPLKEGAAFLQNLFVYFPLNVYGLLSTPDSTLWLAVPAAWQLPVLLAAVAFLAYMAWGMWGVLRARAEARFLALGCLLAVVPPCSTLPADRNLMLASLGAMGLVGLTIEWYRRAATHRKWQTPERIFVGILVSLHLVLSPLTLPGASYAISYMDRGFQHVNNSAVPPVPAPGARYVALNTPVDLLGASLPIFRAAAGQEQPERWWWLCAGPDPVEVARTGERLLVLRPENGYFRQPFGQTFRWPGGYPMKAGDEVPLDGMTARVTEASEDGRPLEVQFVFDRPLDSPDFHWMTWSEGEYVPVTLPAIGASIVVPGLDIPIVWERMLQMHLPEENTPEDEEKRSLNETTEAGNVPRS